MSNENDELAPGTLIADKYTLVRPLGRGGMGSVWEAVNEAVGKRVAIKLLEPQLAKEAEFMRRFEMEAQASALIDHPGIVDVIDTGTTAWGAPFMVMEYLAGVTLRQLQKSLKQLTPNQAAAVMVPVLDALEAAHAAGVVHRDLKPANILLSLRPRPAVKILDFGISKFQSSDGMTKTGVTLGTPTYMAPEQVKDSRHAGPPADLYSVGAMLYSLLAGRPPFEGDSDMSILARVLTDPPPPLKTARGDLPEPLCRLVDTSLSKSPEGRPQTASQMRQVLVSVAQPETEWLFDAVRDLTPADSRPSMKIPGVATPVRTRSRSSMPAAGGNSLSSIDPTGARGAAKRRASQGAVPQITQDDLPPTHADSRYTRAEKSNRGVIIASVAGVAIIAGAIGLALLLVKSKPEAVGPPVEPIAVTTPPPDVKPLPAVEPPKPAADVSLTLTAKPPEALFAVGEDPPCNPCTLARPVGTKLVARVSAEGFTAQDVPLDFDTARELRVELAPETVANTNPRITPRKGKGGKGKGAKSLELEESNPYQ